MDSTEEFKDKSPRYFRPNIRQTYPKLNILYTFRFYFTYALIYIFAYTRDFVSWVLPVRQFHLSVDTPKNIKAGIQSVVDDSAGFYLRAVFLPVLSCFHRPLVGPPSAQIEIRDRKRKSIFEHLFQLTGKTIKALNFGSYNYLGE